MIIYQKYIKKIKKLINIQIMKIIPLQAGCRADIFFCRSMTEDC